MKHIPKETFKKAFVSKNLPSSHFSSHSILTPGVKILGAFSLLKDRMKEALEGKLAPAIHVMAADCGTGKSTAVQAFLTDWKATGFAGDGSVLIALGTLAEIDTYIAGSSLGPSDYAVCVSDKEYASFGRGLAGANMAQVLFTTHAMMRVRLTGLTSFADAECFHYRGKPRSLRIWDEAFLPVEHATFGLNALRALPDNLEFVKGINREDIAAIEALLPDKAELVPGTALAIPANIRNIARKLVSNIRTDTVKRTLENLARLSGANAYLRGSADEGWDCIGTSCAMPADLAPMFVLDGSAKIPGRYGNWSSYGFDIVQLDPAAVDYAALHIHWWDRGCGKSALRRPKDQKEVYGAIASLVNGKPGEDFLLVMLKEFCSPDASGACSIHADLEALLTNPSQLRVINWGRHLGSNEFRSFKNVILMGDYNYGHAAHEAISLAQTGNPTGIASRSERNSTARNEWAHNMYQALCRVNVRNQMGGICGDANAYFIMQSNADRRAMIGAAFPNCKVGDWKPVAPKRTSKAEFALREIEAQLKTKPIVYKRDIAKAYYGAAKADGFTRVWGKEEFKDGLAALGFSSSKNYFFK